ncbi:MAG TPA: hypothetical protein VF518_11550 [Polyangia bacterium]
MIRGLAGAFLCVVLWFAIPACSLFCERGGCDAAAKPATDKGQSEIAGAVASEGDVVENGCSECPFAKWPLSIWATSEPVNDVGRAKAIIQAGPAMVTLQADGRYRQALDAGSYLLCAVIGGGYGTVCVGISVVAGHATPVNLQLNTGLSRFTVFDPITHAKLATTMFYPGS